MSLSRVSVTAVRNLHPVTFSPSPRINILYGANGSGKTCSGSHSSAGACPFVS